MLNKPNNWENINFLMKINRYLSIFLPFSSSSVNPWLSLGWDGKVGRCSNLLTSVFDERFLSDLK